MCVCTPPPTSLVAPLLAGMSTGAIAFCISGMVSRIYDLKQWLILEHFALGGASAHYAYMVRRVGG